MAVYTQKHQILDRLKKEPLADISDMLDDYVLGQLAMEEQDKTEAEIRDDFWESWRETADCTRLQGELALTTLGMIEGVEALVNDPATPQAVKSAYKRAYRWSRRSGMWAAMAPLLNKTEEDVDDFFKLAQSIQG